MRVMPVSDARRTFRDAPVVHVATILPDGSPHVVPLWFVWFDEAVYVSCRTGSRVWRNLVRDPRVALEFERGRAWTEQEGVVVRGAAEVLAHEHPSAKRALSAWFEKYRGEFGAAGFASYAEHVAEPALFRVTPEHISGWSHAGPAD